MFAKKNIEVHISIDMNVLVVELYLIMYKFLEKQCEHHILKFVSHFNSFLQKYLN